MYFHGTGVQGAWGDEQFWTLGNDIDNFKVKLQARPSYCIMSGSIPSSDFGSVGMFSYNATEFHINLKSIWQYAQNHFGRSFADRLYAVALDVESGNVLSDIPPIAFAEVNVIQVAAALQEWFGRTNPTGHYYIFYMISTPYGVGCHIDTIGSPDYNYQMLGYKLTDYIVGANGKIRVRGYFRQADTFPSDLQPGRRLLNIYVMHSENINNIVKTVQVLDYSDGIGWKYIDVIVDGLIAGKPITVGIGRPDSWESDWSLIAEWTGIEILEGVGNPPFPPLIPSAPYGPWAGYEGYSYTYSTSTTDLDNDNLYYQFYWGDGTTTTVGPYASGATASASHYWPTEGTYGVRVRAQDSTGLWSGWSSSLIVHIHCHDGGGGGYCPFVSVWDGSNYVPDNNVLPRSVLSNGTDVEDYYRLEQAPVRENGKYLLRLSEFASDHSYFDKVNLLAVDHQSDVNVALTPEGGILTYKKPTAPISAVDKNGTDKLSEIGLMDGNVSDSATYFQGHRDDYIVLNFGKVESDYAKLILRDDQKKQDDTTCILVQVKDGSGAWQTVETLVPRAYWSMEAVDLSPYVVQGQDFTVRLYWLQPHRLDYVGLDTTPQASYDTHKGYLVSAIHSTQGNVKAQLSYSDNIYAELLPGERIMLIFWLPSNARQARTFIFYAEGHYYTIP